MRQLGRGSSKVKKIKILSTNLQNNTFSRPDSEASIDWFSEKQTKVLRKIRQYLQKNETNDEPRAVGQARLLYNACLNTSNAP